METKNIKRYTFNKFMKGMKKMKRKNKKEEVTNLAKVNNFIDYNKKLEADDKTFEKLMFIYSTAIKELQTKVEIMKDEFKIFYNYDLIDHINTRVKTPESIKTKMDTAVIAVPLQIRKKAAEEAHADAAAVEAAAVPMVCA